MQKHIFTRLSVCQFMMSIEVKSDLSVLVIWFFKSEPQSNDFVLHINVQVFSSLFFVFESMGLSCCENLILSDLHFLPEEIS